jgi:GNAT superfamily N-acetyltransferase
VKTVTPDSVKELCRLQDEYSREVLNRNGAMEEGFYLHFPPLEGGKNVFCIFDSDNRMIGYNMIFRPLIDEDSPGDVEYELWCDLTVLPAYQDKKEVNDLLFEKIMDRAKEIQKELPQRKLLLTKGIFPAEAYSVSLFTAKGLTEKEKLMTLFVDIPERPAGTELPEGLTLKRYMPKDIDEKTNFLKAHNQVFSEAPFDVESLDAHFSSEGWTVGTLICAFDTKGDVVAGIKAYTYKDELSGTRTGITDSIFTLPDWRGKGIGKNLINEALRFFHENGIKQACLEVSSLNDKAFNLYTRMGYKVVGEKIIMTKSL